MNKRGLSERDDASVSGEYRKYEVYIMTHRNKSKHVVILAKSKRDAKITATIYPHYAKQVYGAALKQKAGKAR